MLARGRLLANKLSRYFWLLADQGIFAVGNYATNLLFARWLTPLDYGFFSVSLGVYALLSVLHYGALVEPFLIQAANLAPDKRRSFVVTSGVIQVAACATIAGLTALGLLVFPEGIAWPIFAAGAGGSFLMSQLIFRRLCFVFLSAKSSALIGAAYGIVVIATAYTFHVRGEIKSYDPWIIMGFWAALGSGAMFLMLIFGTARGSHYSLASLFEFQRRYAPWSVLAAASSWARVEGLLLFSTRMIGVEQIAATRAIINLGNPLAQVVVAMDASWLVTFAERSQRGDPARLGRILLWIVAASSVAAALAWAGNTYLVKLVYGGRYLDVAWQMPIHWLGIGCLAIEGLIASMYKSSRRILRGYGPQTLGAMFSVAIGLLLMVPLFGQPGVLYAALASEVFGMVFCLTAVWLDKPRYSWPGHAAQISTAGLTRRK